MQLLGSWQVPKFFDSIDWLVPVMGGFVALWMLGNFVATVFIAGSLGYALVVFISNMVLPGSVPISAPWHETNQPVAGACRHRCSH